MDSSSSSSSTTAALDDLAFSCKKGSIIAVYAAPEEEYRFWIAEAIAPIHKGRPDQKVFIYYYVEKPDPDMPKYTCFKVEGDRKRKSVIDYRHCLTTVSWKARKNDLIFITEHERDRIFAIGKALDEQSDDESTNEQAK